MLTEDCHEVIMFVILNTCRRLLDLDGEASNEDFLLKIERKENETFASFLSRFDISRTKLKSARLQESHLPQWLSSSVLYKETSTR